MPLDLATADRFAAKILAELQPICERIEVAGSVRRRRPFVNDLDFVAIPHAGQDRQFRARVKQNALRVLTDGSDIITIVLPLRKNPEPGTRNPELQIDFFLAARASSDMFAKFPSNFGTILLIRTGSTAHNIYMIERAKQLGRTLNPHHGVFGPDANGKTQCLACETERDIFAALDLDFIPPEKRER